MTAIKSYKDLLVWQKAMVLVNHVYRITRQFPKEETFGLAQQMRRAAVSVVSNIAEGSVRSSRKDFANFVTMSRGSVAELETQWLVAQNQGLIPDSEEGMGIKLMDEISRMLMSLNRSLRSS